MNRKIIYKYLTGIVYILLIVLLYRAMDDYTQKAYNGNEALYQSVLPVQMINVSDETTENDQSIAADQSNTDDIENKYDILIDLNESTLYLFEDGKMIKRYPVAQGKSDTPSPIGLWHITNKARNWGTGFGTRWMGLNVPWGIYGIHGTNKPGSIGTRASHGCFRMQNRDVEELYSIVPFKTRVLVYGGPYANMGNSFDELAPGDRKSQVAEVQKRLQKLGYYQGTVDGIYGEGMKASLIKFKKDYNLPITHFVDLPTYQALGILKFD